MYSCYLVYYAYDLILSVVTRLSISVNFQCIPIRNNLEGLGFNGIEKRSLLYNSVVIGHYYN